MLCAIIELKLLGVKINIEYEQKIRQLNKNRKIKKKKEQDADLYLDSDYYFFYIVGYTSNGFPYGITWEEARKNPELFSDEKEGINENI